jgi:hypothetical protein
MLVTLLLIVCLSSDPTCTTPKTIDPMYDKISLPACEMQGQTALTQWLNEHPQYIGHGWACRIGDQPHYNGKGRDI